MQNWNSLLEYIKYNLGAPNNSIELSDDEIIKYIKSNTLVEISNYVPLRKHVVLNSEDIIDSKIGKYKLNTDDYILDVIRIIYSTSSYGHIDSKDAIMSLIGNYVESMKSYLSPGIHFYFESPYYIIFNDSIRSSLMLPALVEYSTVYKTLDEMPADIYHNYFKKMSLADIMILLGMNRSKYVLSSPFGQIENNGSELLNKGEQLKRSILNELSQLIPPDKFIDFID